MIQSFVHTSESGNFYLYDDQHRLSMLVHPEFEKVCRESIFVDSYYVGKYAYLKEHAFFSEPKLANIETVVDELMVRESIIHTQQILFEVTDSCNLKCSYCAYGELYEGYDIRNYKNINVHYAITLLKYIFDLNPKNKNRKLGICFYGGEPLLNMNFIKQIVEVTDQLNAEKEMDVSYIMTTNATLIHKYKDFLAANKFRLSISLDGNEGNHSYRVFNGNNKNSFHKVIENVDMLQSDYPDYFKSHVNFIAVLHNRNSVKEVYDFIYTRYNKIPAIAELALDDINPNRRDILRKMFHSKNESEAKYLEEESNLIHHTDLSLFKELTDFLKHYSINYYISNVTTLLKDEEKYLPTNTCLPFSKKVFLTNRNRLLPCERINYKYSMGKVDQSVEIDIPKITQQFHEYYEQFKNVCQNCYAYRFCGLCMFQMENLDKLGTEEFVCDRFHDQKAFQNKLYRIFSFIEKYPEDFSQILENVVIS